MLTEAAFMLIEADFMLIGTVCMLIGTAAFTTIEAASLPIEAMDHLEHSSLYAYRCGLSYHQFICFSVLVNI